MAGFPDRFWVLVGYDEAGKVGLMQRTLYMPDGKPRSAGNACVNAENFIACFETEADARGYMDALQGTALTPWPIEFSPVDVDMAELMNLLARRARGVIASELLLLPEGSDPDAHIWQPVTKALEHGPKEGQRE